MKGQLPRRWNRDSNDFAESFCEDSSVPVTVSMSQQAHQASLRAKIEGGCFTALKQSDCQMKK
jgi:hypothetical protein